ncbi:MAG: VCBS repeat-containing protein [Planctomycetaceae bacterium]|nr:VCBS repeat-containing protein [Planctomycetaceae bacterium]
MTRRRIAVAGLTVTIVLAAIPLTYRILSGDVKTLLQSAGQDFVRGRTEHALSAVREVLSREPDHPEALVLAGDICFSLKQYDEALVYYRGVPTGSSPKAVHAKFRCGRIEMHHTGDAAAAEADFRTALQFAPNDRNGLFQLAGLLGIQARRREAVPLILQLFRQEVFHLDFLTLLSNDDAALFNREELDRYHRANSSHPGTLVGLAWHARHEGRTERAVELLKLALKTDPRFPEPYAALAGLFRRTDRLAEFRTLPVAEEVRRRNDPRLWLIRGQLAEQEHLTEEAARCFHEALLLDPVNHAASYKLFRYFTETGNAEAAAFLQQRIDMLLDLRSTLDRITSEPIRDAEPIRKLVDILERLDRLWEAWGWCIVARDVDRNAGWAAVRSAELQSALQNAPLNRVCRPLNAPFDLSHLPEPRWEVPAPKQTSESTEPTSAVTFRDDAAELGIRFQYFNSPSPPDTGRHMYEFNGGGCGVIDIDADGAPDVHFTQGCPWELRGQQTKYFDSLFRNINGRRFQDVSAEAGIADNHFSTGIAVGDFDNDGFDDVYIANIGNNRLLHNNGDGTFDDVTDTAGAEDPGWTTSCVMADLNGDGLPDIYSVNYLQGDSVFETVCQHQDGHPRMCMPFHFEAAQDQLYINLGNGRFRNATAESGIQIPDGKGLGLLAARWEGTAGLSLFVANDTTANFLFTPRSRPNESTFGFEEAALPAGVALNHSGRAEGCMGIAAGDVDEDGDIDLFVTNFLRESNTLYLAQPGPVFTDSTRDAGLEEPSLQMLGFGTQFLDADLDGRLDLLTANGHIDDYRRYGRPYTMPPQFYLNTGQGRFALQPGSSIGDYFSHEYLGRSLARWDCNRDGREDAVISNLDQPAAVLTNTTEHHGRFLAVRLRGTNGARDAIGASVTVRFSDRSLYRQLTGGDGYQSGNERRLVFGLGEHSDDVQVDLDWPSGTRETYSGLRPGREYLFVESVRGPFLVRSSRSGKGEKLVFLQNPKLD